MIGHTPLLLSRPAAAQALGISLAEIKRQIRAGKIKEKCLGRRRLIAVDELARFAANLQEKQVAA